MKLIQRMPAGAGAPPPAGGFDTALRRALDRSINGLERAGSAGEELTRRSVADAAARSAEQLLREGARRAALRRALQPQIARYAVLAERADALLHEHVFADSERLFGFLWDLFNGPIWDQAQAAVRQMTAAERAVFVGLHELLQQTDRLAGDEGLALVLRSYHDRYLTVDGELSDALVGVLAGLGRA